MKISGYHRHQRRRRWHMLRRPHHTINYLKMKSNTSLYWQFLLYHRDKSTMESRCMEPSVTSHRSYWRTRWIKSGCRPESCPAGFRYHWMRKMASNLPLHWLVGGGKCCVGVAGLMETGQSAVQRETHIWANECGRKLLPWWKSWL